MGLSHGKKIKVSSRLFHLFYLIHIHCLRKTTIVGFQQDFYIEGNMALVFLVKHIHLHLGHLADAFIQSDVQ